MEFLSEDYKNRLQELAGLNEALTPDQYALYDKSTERVPFDRALMRQAIERGMEIGLSFQSNNAKYKMPITKYRIIQPVAMGTSTTGELVVRGLHVIGQSERAARETGIRSAEVQDEWRLFKAKNIKGMWLTGRYFHGPMPGYNPNDHGMSSVEVSINFSKAKSYQDELSKQNAYKEREKQLQQQDKVRPLFKQDISKLPPSQLKKQGINPKTKDLGIGQDPSKF